MSYDPLRAFLWGACSVLAAPAHSGKGRTEAMEIRTPGWPSRPEAASAAHSAMMRALVADPSRQVLARHIAVLERARDEDDRQLRNAACLSACGQAAALALGVGLLAAAFALASSGHGSLGMMPPLALMGLMVAAGAWQRRREREPARD